MRIAVYCPPFDDVSGVQEVVRHLSTHMIARGHAVAIVARTRRGSAPTIDAASGATILRARIERVPHRALGMRAYRRFVRRFPRAAIQVVQAVRGWEADVVATHCSKFHAPYVLALRLATRVPIAVHLHNGPVTADGPESPRLQRLLERCASRVVAVSEPVGEYARRCLPARADRVVVVPNAIDRERFVTAIPAVRARPYILGVGRLASQKGFDVLLDAVAMAESPYEVVLAGDGPDREALERQSQARGIAARVTFLGSVDGDAVAMLMRGAAVVAIPSRFEGYSLVSREAMAAGVPIVATDLPEMTSDLRHLSTALVVPVDDVAALAASLRRLHDEPELAARLAAAAAEASRRLDTWADVSVRLLGEYGDIVAEARGDARLVSST